MYMKKCVKAAYWGEYHEGSWIYSETVEEFVEETGTWKPTKSLPEGRSRYGGVAITKDIVCD